MDEEMRDAGNDESSPTKSTSHLGIPVRSRGASEKVEINSPRLIRSRRRRYLELNPSYFEAASADVELIDPLAYDRLIRQHQSTEEREIEGKKKGWAKTLETSLIRGEAKLAALRVQSEQTNGGGVSARSEEPDGTRTDWSIGESKAVNRDSEQNEDGNRKAVAQDRWKDLIAERFIKGLDDSFDYDSIDTDENLDAEDHLKGGWLEREKQDDWFNEEEEESEGKVLEGQTGIQDF